MTRLDMWREVHWLVGLALICTGVGALVVMAGAPTWVVVLVGVVGGKGWDLIGLRLYKD